MEISAEIVSEDPPRGDVKTRSKPHAASRRLFKKTDTSCGRAWTSGMRDLALMRSPKESCGLVFANKPTLCP